MHQVSLYLWKLQKLFYFVTGKNIDWKKTEQLPITVQQGLFVFTEITLAMALSVEHASVHFWYILNFDNGKHKQKCLLLATLAITSGHRSVLLSGHDVKNNCKCFY